MYICSKMILNWRLRILLGFLFALCHAPFKSQTNPSNSIKSLIFYAESSDEFDPIRFHQKILKIKSGQNNMSYAILSAYDMFLNGNEQDFNQTMSKLSSDNSTLKDDYLVHLRGLLLCEFYCNSGQIEDAKKIAIRHLDATKKTRKNRWLSQAFLNFSSIYSHENNKDSSLFYAEKSLLYAKRSNSELQLLLSLMDLSEIHYQFNHFEECVSKALSAVQLAEKIKNKYYQCLLYRKISELSLEANNSNEAENYLRKSMLQADKLGYPSLKAYNAVTNAAIQSVLGIPENSMLELKKAAQQLEQNNNTQESGKAWLVLGMAYNALKQADESLLAYDNALKFFQMGSNVAFTAQIYHNMGIVYFEMKNYRLAQQFVMKSIELRSQFRDNTKIYENYWLMSQIYAAQNNKPIAYEYLKKYNTYLRSHSTSIDSKKIEELTQTNSREERERLIELQGDKLEKELKEKEILQLQSDRQLLGISVAITILFLGGIIVLFFNRQRNALQEQREVEMSQTLLRSQMNPHFIFNALAVIQSYLYDNTPERTSQFLVNFSRLIRLILENSPKEFITLDIEKEILSKYLTTQKLRFEERFDFILNIDEDLIEKKAMIPPMITQPFVENSIEHGQLHTVEGGLIEISIREVNEMMEIKISDNGVGRKKAGKIKRNRTHKSMAMDITQERISIMNKKHNSKGSMVVEDKDQIKESGTEVIICLPLIYENTIFEKR